MTCLIESFPSRNTEQSSNGQLTLEERISQLNELASRRPVIRLNGQKFRNLVGSKSHPRNYSMVVMMTALTPSRQCQVCRQAYDEFVITANSWRYNNNNQQSPVIYFAMVDYDEGSDVFNLLSINSAPVFLFFSKDNKNVKNADQLDIQRIGFSSEVIAKWVQEKTNNEVVIKVVRPPNYATSIAVLLLMAVFGSIVYLKRNNLEYAYNKTAWASAAVIVVLIMVSGQMWNHIRGPPLMHRSNKGISYIHGSSSGQFVIETYIIMVLYALTGLGFVLMNEALRGSSSKSNDGGKKRKVMAITGIILTSVFFSLLLSVFRGKAHGYPYSFLFK